jgi:tRNA nucleotidyltransferase/poly(A) polymerase
MFILVGCAKQPTEDMSAAQKAVEDLKATGAEKYIPEETKKLDDSLAAALNEIKAQDGKFALSRNYDKAKQMLAQVKADAEKVKADIAAKKEEAKKNALAGQQAAGTSVKEAKALLAKAPKGKGTGADIAALKGDVKALEDSLPELQQLIDKEDYAVVIDKAKAIKEKAEGVSNQIKEAMKKVKGK